MNYQEMSPLAICAELGGRLKQARLNLNITQQELATKAGLSRKAVMNAERGDSSLVTFVAIMSALGLTEKLDLFLPKVLVSPVELLKLAGKQRRRARGSLPNEGENESEPASW